MTPDATLAAALRDRTVALLAALSASRRSVMAVECIDELDLPGRHPERVAELEDRLEMLDRANGAEEE